METVLNAFYGMVERGPLGLWAFIAGNVIHWGVMLRLRTISCAVLSAHSLAFLGHGVAFAVTLAVSWLVWPTVGGAIVGIAVGLWGPFSWGLVLLLLEWKFPKAAAWLRAPG